MKRKNELVEVDLPTCAGDAFAGAYNQLMKLPGREEDVVKAAAAGPDPTGALDAWLVLEAEHTQAVAGVPTPSVYTDTSRI